MTHRSRLGRELRWVRSEGINRFFEEKEIHPVVGARNATASWRWRRAHRRPAGSARPVWLLGLQRSGTNMVMRSLRAMPSAEVYNESDRRAFVDYRLRDDDVIDRLLARSRSDLVAFKPLSDSHRALELLDKPWPAAPGRVVWVYRSMDDRVRSAVSRFGDAARQALVRIAAGDVNLWQAGGMGDEQRALLERFPPDRLDVVSAQALWWYLRNQLFFDLGLDQRPDAYLLSYDRLVDDPSGEMARLCHFLGVPPDERATRSMAPRPASRDTQPIDLQVRALGAELTARLVDVERNQDPGPTPTPAASAGAS